MQDVFSWYTHHMEVVGEHIENMVVFLFMVVMKQFGVFDNSESGSGEPKSACLEKIDSPSTATVGLIYIEEGCQFTSRRRMIRKE